MNVLPIKIFLILYLIFVVYDIVIEYKKNKR